MQYLLDKNKESQSYANGRGKDSFWKSQRLDFFFFWLEENARPK